MSTICQSLNLRIRSQKNGIYVILSNNKDLKGKKIRSQCQQKIMCKLSEIISKDIHVQCDTIYWLDLYITSQKTYHICKLADKELVFWDWKIYGKWQHLKSNVIGIRMENFQYCFPLSLCLINKGCYTSIWCSGYEFGLWVSLFGLCSNFALLNNCNFDQLT